MKSMRIALIQMNALFSDIAGNLAKIERLAREAAALKADIICYPELCLQGYSRSESGFWAEHVPGPTTDKILNIARTYGLTMLVGLAEQSGTDKPYITQFVACPDGNWGRYRKTHLGASEKPHFLPGQELPVFHSSKAHWGLLICLDLHFPEAATILSLKGAEIIFVPHASPVIMGDRRQTWLKYMPARAYDNSLFVASCNLVGDDGCGRSFCGGAMVIDPKGNIIAESFAQDDHLLVVDLEPQQINRIRHGESSSMRHSFYLDARRPDLYGDILLPPQRERQ